MSAEALALDESFVVCGIGEEIPREASRDDARSGWRVFASRAGIEVAVSEMVIDQLMEFGRRAEPNEWYALLVGRLCSDEQGLHVTVDGAVLDVDALATSGSVRTSDFSERETRRLASAQRPGTIPLGWAHGHVRCGARFSAADRANQRSWTQPHAVGIVVDPWDEHPLGVFLGPSSEPMTHVTAFAADGEVQRQRATTSDARVPGDAEPAPAPYEAHSSSWANGVAQTAGILLGVGLVTVLGHAAVLRAQTLSEGLERLSREIAAIPPNIIQPVSCHQNPLPSPQRRQDELSMQQSPSEPQRIPSTNKSQTPVHHDCTAGKSGSVSDKARKPKSAKGVTPGAAKGAE